MARKTSELRPVMTRIPENLRRRLEREAAKNGRSMNTEIIHRLELSFSSAEERADSIRTIVDQTVTSTMRLMMANGWQLTGAPLTPAELEELDGLKERKGLKLSDLGKQPDDKREGDDSK